MPCERESLPSRRAWAWRTTTTVLPPVSALIAAIVTAVIAYVMLHQPLLLTLAASLVVGGTTFVVLLGYNYLRAPAGIEAEGQRRLTEWRGQFRVKAEVRPKSVVLFLYAPHAGQLEQARCEVRHESGQEWRASQPPIREGTVSGMKMALCVWRFPADFGAPSLQGRHTASWFLAGHEGSAGDAQWDGASS